MSDQSRLALLSEGPTADIVRSSGAVRSFQQGGPVQVVRTKDDPYLAGMSEDHRRVYIDKRVPKQLNYKGKIFDPAKYLVVHETIERRHMDKGMKYEPAHRLALKAERAAVEADGINWNWYQGQMHRLAGITEKEKNVHPPRDLYKGPFPRREQNKLTKEGDTAPDIKGSTKGYAEGGEVEGGIEATPEDMKQYGLDPNGPPQEATPEDMQRFNLNPNGPPEYSVAGEALKRGAQAVLPGLGSIPAMVGGAELGGAAGSAIAPGPGTLVGGLVGAAAGGIAANVSLRKIQDWFLDKLGIAPDEEKAQAFQQEHPNIATAADIAGSLVGMSPGSAATTLTQRAAMGAGQAGIEAGSEYLHTGELDPTNIAMAAAAGAAFPSLNKLGEPLGQAGSRFANRLIPGRQNATEGQAGRPDLKQLPKPPDFTTSAEGETAPYPGGDDQVFGQAAAPRPGTPGENARPIYEMPRSEWTVTRPGTRDVDNIAPGAKNDTPTKTQESVQSDKRSATPAHGSPGVDASLSTAHEVPPPRKDENIGNPQSFPVGSERDYRTTTDSNVHPTSSGAGNPPTGEMLDPSKGNIAQDVMQAMTQDNGPGRNTPPRGLKAADQRMQKSMRVPFEGEAANENVEGAGQPQLSVVPEAPKPIPSEEEGEAFNRSMATQGVPAPKEEAHPEIGAIVKTPEGKLTVHTGEGNYEEINTKKGAFTAVRIPSETETVPAASEKPKNLLTDTEGTFKPFEYMRAEKKVETYKIFDHEGNETATVKVGVVGNRAYIIGKGMDELGSGPMKVLRQQLLHYYPDLKQVIKPPKGFLSEKQPVGTEVPTEPKTGIVEGAVADTAQKLRDYDMPDAAAAVEKNPAIEPQARKILQDLTAKVEEHGAVSPEELQRVTRIMDKIDKEESETPEERTAKLESKGKVAQLGEETVTANTIKLARQKALAAQAAQTAFEKHPPTDNKIPTTQQDIDLFKRRLTSALETAKQENLGKDPLALNPRKRTAAQDWLRSAQKIVNAKEVTPAMIKEFIGDENMARRGATGKELRGFKNVEQDVALNRRKQNTEEDRIDAAMNTWKEQLSPEDRASWENELSNTEDDNGDEYVHESSAGRKAGLDDYESKKATGAEYYHDLLRDMFRDDAGIFRPQAFLASLRDVFGPKARLYAESYRAREPEGVKEEYARSIDDGLNQVQKMEGGVWLDRQREAATMPDVIKQNDEKIYLAHERDDIASLSPDEKAAYYQKLQPVFEENDHLFRQIEAIHPGLLGPKVENHIQRIPKGYHPDFGGDPIANVTAARNKRGLSTMTGTLKHREFMALEDPQGNRTVISPTDNGYAEWNNHVQAYRQNAAFEDKPGVQFRDHNGVLQTVRDALTPEIEQHANFSNGKPATYVKSSILSALATNAELRNTLSRLQYLESIKSDLVSRNMATTDPKQAERNGWQKSIMPQFDKYYMTDHLRAVLDDFAAPGLTHGEAWDKVRALSEKVTKMMFVDPVFHLANVGTHWFTDRGWDWIKPEKLRVLASTSAQAIKSVLNQDLLQDTLYEHGAGMQYRGVLNQNRLMNIFTAAGHAIESNPSKWDPIARVMGMSSRDLARAIYRNSSKIMWAGNDMFYTQRVLERMHDGANMQDAIMETEKHFPNYRVPSYIIGANDWGRLASRMLRDNTLFAFGPYHYGVFNSYAHIVKDAVKGNGQERIDAAGKMFAMGLLAFAVYPALDKIARLATGNPDAEFRRRGPLNLPNHIVRAAQGKEDALNTGSQGTLTISPLVQGVQQQLMNRDFVGRPINEPGDVEQSFQGPNRMTAMGRLVVQRAASMADNFISPVAMAGRAIEDANGPLRGLIAQVSDIKNPSPKAVRYERQAAQIEKQKALTRQQHGGLTWEEGLYNRLTR